MSLDIDRVVGLLQIVREAAQHPSNLASLGALAMKELTDHNRDAKIEHDKWLAEQAKETAAKRLDDAQKAKKVAEEEAKRAELTNRPQRPLLPAGVEAASRREDQAKADVALAEAQAKQANEVKKEPLRTALDQAQADRELTRIRAEGELEAQRTGPQTRAEVEAREVGARADLLNEDDSQRVGVHPVSRPASDFEEEGTGPFPGNDEANTIRRRNITEEVNNG